MGGNPTIFAKDQDTAEEGRLKVLVAKHMASLQLLSTVGGNQARLDARAELKFWSPRQHSCISRHSRDRFASTAVFLAYEATWGRYMLHIYLTYYIIYIKH